MKRKDSDLDALGDASAAPAQPQAHTVLNPELVQLEHLDRLDRELGRIENERSRLRSRMTERETAVTERDRARDQAREALDASKAEERAANRRVEELQTSRKAALRVLETGIGNADAAQRQLDRCDGLIDEAETAILELMERLDGLARAATAADGAARDATAALAAEREAQPDQLATLTRQHGAASGERVGVAAALPADLRTRYDDFRARNRWAVARIVANACESCSMSVQPQMAVDLRNNKLVSCHGCHRWLYPG